MIVWEIIDYQNIPYSGYVGLANYVPKFEIKFAYIQHNIRTYSLYIIKESTDLNEQFIEKGSVEELKCLANSIYRKEKIENI
jgi:hypothetical protein